MFCSGCGQAMQPGQTACAQCGPLGTGNVHPIPGFQFQLESYAGKIRLLSILPVCLRSAFFPAGDRGTDLRQGDIFRRVWPLDAWAFAAYVDGWGIYPPDLDDAGGAGRAGSGRRLWADGAYAVGAPCGHCGGHFVPDQVSVRARRLACGLWWFCLAIRILRCTNNFRGSFELEAASTTI